MYHIQFPKLGLSFDIDPVAFKIGDFSVYWYGIILAIGFSVAFIYVIKNCKRFGIDVDKIIDCVIVGLITGIIGARLFYVVFFPGDTYTKNPMSIFYIHQGGLAIYGGITGGLLGGVTMAKVKKLSILPALDVVALGFLIGQAIGRWGNFVNQEAFGSATDLPWGMMSQNTLFESLKPVHPCFLYESLWCLLGIVILDLFSRKFRQYDGQIFLLYLVWYGLERFFVEGLRTDSLMIPGLSIKVSQAIAILTSISGIILLITFRKRKTKCIDNVSETLDGNEKNESVETQQNIDEVQDVSKDNRW